MCDMKGFQYSDDSGIVGPLEQDEECQTRRAVLRCRKFGISGVPLGCLWDASGSDFRFLAILRKSMLALVGPLLDVPFHPA